MGGLCLGREERAVGTKARNWRMMGRAGAVLGTPWPGKGQPGCGAWMARTWDCQNVSCNGVTGYWKCHLCCLHLPRVKLGQWIFPWLGYLSCRFISTFLQCAPRSSWAMSPLCGEVLVKARGCEVSAGVEGCLRAAAEELLALAGFKAASWSICNLTIAVLRLHWVWNLLENQSKVALALLK